MAGPEDKHDVSSKDSIDDSTKDNQDALLPNQVSPEIMFLLREHAKALSSLHSISKRLESLEVKVCDMQRSLNESVVRPSSSGGTTTAVLTANHHHHNAHHQVISDGKGAVSNDDSGGEFSGTTTGTAADEDELNSVLDQILKHSQQIRASQEKAQQHQLLVNRVSNPSSSSPSSSSSSSPSSHHRVTAAAITHNNHHQSHPSQHVSHSGVLLHPRSPSSSRPVITSNSSPSSQLLGSHQSPIRNNFNPGRGVSMMMPSVHQNRSSLNAVLFDPNLSNVLAGLNEDLSESNGQQ